MATTQRIFKSIYHIFAAESSLVIITETTDNVLFLNLSDTGAMNTMFTKHTNPESRIETEKEWGRLYKLLKDN